MDRRKLARRVQTAKNSVSLKPDRAQYAVKKAARKSLSPLQRLQKFKKLVEKQSKQHKTKLKKNLRVTFALDMEVESVVVNGSHEPEVGEKTDEKILKPRKPVLSLESDAAEAVPNGNSENGSVSGTVETVNGENGIDEEIEDNDRKPIKKGSQAGDKREGTPKKKTSKESTPIPETLPKRELRRRETPQKESTPIPETLPKRELRRRETPQKESTPKPETSNKRKGKSAKDATSQADHEADVKSSENGESEEKNITNVEDGVIDEVVIIDDSLDESKSESRSLFSIFRRSTSGKSPDSTKNMSVASPSSPSIICLDSPSYTPGSDIKGRKAINAFSRFPGRNVSITSVDSSASTKRKAEAESICEDSPRKRFAGATESGSEKSPGWRFFSPNFGRMWSPSQQQQKSHPSSTPCGKHAEQDSMAVNYDEETKLSLDDDEETPSVSSTPASPAPAKAHSWCAVM